jgi:hypothetical protein
VLIRRSVHIHGVRKKLRDFFIYFRFSGVFDTTMAEANRRHRTTCARRGLRSPHLPTRLTGERPPVKGGNVARSSRLWTTTPVCVTGGQARKAEPSVRNELVGEAAVARPLPVNHPTGRRPLACALPHTRPPHPPVNSLPAGWCVPTCRTLARRHAPLRWLRLHSPRRCGSIA